MHCTHAHTRMHTRREHWKQQTRAAQVWMRDQHTQPAAPAPPRGGPAGTGRGREAARTARLRLGQCPGGPACRDGGQGGEPLFAGRKVQPHRRRNRAHGGGDGGAALGMCPYRGNVCSETGRTGNGTCQNSKRLRFKGQNV